MRLFLITIALYALRGPEKTQMLFALLCVVIVPLWAILSCVKRHVVRQGDKKVPDMSYLYGARK